MKKKLRKKASKEAFVNEVDIKVITNDIKINNSGVINRNSDAVLYYGINNQYPNETYNAIRLSPTAKGVKAMRSKFIYGNGIEGGDIVVNRSGQTLNQVFRKIAGTASWLESYVLHFNYNLLGQIIEITPIDIRIVRKLQNLQQAMLANYNPGYGGYYTGDNIKIYLYNIAQLQKQIQADGGFDKFKGNIFYWTIENEIYTLSNLDASLPSAQLENKIQIYNYATIENGFSGSGIVKVPEFQNGKNDSLDENLQKLKGAENAGSWIKVTVPRNLAGDMGNLNLVESFTPNNIDKLYINQSQNAKNNILRENGFPEILLGVNNAGMFNQDSYDQAFNYYNSQMSETRSLIEESLNSFWENTIFSETLNDIQIIPLEMKEIGENNGSSVDND